MTAVRSEFGTLRRGFSVQARVIGALLLREMHTRFGRENIGYIWLIAEPMLLATVIGIMHMGQHTEYSTDITPLGLTVVGYTIFIMFRGIVNRSEGAMEANATLMYHRMVTPDDVVLARALLEGGGTLGTVLIMLSALIAIGQAPFPTRPLMLALAIFFQFWSSWGQAMIVTTISNDNRTIGRLVHVYTYFMIPLSGAFIQIEWIPDPYRSYLLWLPMPHIFEMARYGVFKSATDKYFSITYLTGFCLVTMLIGLVSMRILRRKMHVS
ncbi:ABC transporter permease [Sphingomonas bacterium]|uniref:ABC transporter permease n=1 Tax=Sphingomonas bacterium TaxID=1895847 RepID=UPI001575D661|nr:ABC transporter permease [Sphingomonas bacterium]